MLLFLYLGFLFCFESQLIAIFSVNLKVIHQMHFYFEMCFFAVKVKVKVLPGSNSHWPFRYTLVIAFTLLLMDPSLNPTVQNSYINQFYCL